MRARSQQINRRRRIILHISHCRKHSSHTSCCRYLAIKSRTERLRFHLRRRCSLRERDEQMQMPLCALVKVKHPSTRVSWCRDGMWEEPKANWNAILSSICLRLCNWPNTHARASAECNYTFIYAFQCGRKPHFRVFRQNCCNHQQQLQADLLTQTQKHTIHTWEKICQTENIWASCTTT